MKSVLITVASLACLAAVPTVAFAGQKVDMAQLTCKDFLADQDVVRRFVEVMPQEIRQLEHWGIPWTRDDQGRSSVALDDTQAWAVWLREDGAGAQSLWLSRRSADLATEYERVELARLEGRGRATGFPRLQLVGRDAYVVWTDVIDGAPQLQGLRLVR